MAGGSACRPESPSSVLRIFPKDVGHGCRFIKAATMKITRQITPDSVPDAARWALFLHVFVRQPVAPRRRNIRGR